MLTTSAKLLCVAAIASVSVPAQAVQLLTNGGFQAGLAGWTSYTTANGTIAENPSLPGALQPQAASVVSFDVTGRGASDALFLNAGKIAGPYNAAPGEGGGVFQTFSTTGGAATFSADIAALYTRTSGFGGLGLMSVLLDGVEQVSYDFGGGSSGPVTLRSRLAFSTDLTAGVHTLSLQATRLFAPSRGVASQYFDNVSLDVAAVAAVPEPGSWALMMMGMGVLGASLRHTRRLAAPAHS